MKNFKLFSCALICAVCSNQVSFSQETQSTQLATGGFTFGAEFGAVFNKYKYKLSEIQTSKEERTSKSKTGFLGALTLGYDIPVAETLILGIDSSIGYNFDSKAKYGNYGLRRTVSIDLAPRFGFMASDMFEIYLKAGMNYSRYKSSYQSVNIDSKGKFSPIVGLGIRYNVNKNFGLSVSFTHQFKRNQTNFGKILDVQMKERISAYNNRICFGVFAKI